MTTGAVACLHYQQRPSAPPARVLVVDDHCGVRAALVQLFSGEDDLTVVGECEDGAQAVEAAHQLRPDIIVMDLSMPRVDGLTATRLLLADRPDSRVVILTAAGDRVRDGAVAAGARAFVHKGVRAAVLLRAVRSTLAGCHCAFGSSEGGTSTVHS